MTLDDLNLLVTQAIRRAELLEELGAPTVKEAWAEVSLIEEQLALKQEASSAGGYFARRGAVNAAFKAGDVDRAEMLLEYFDREGPATVESLSQFREELTRHLKLYATRFPFAARKYGVEEMRRIEKLVAERGGVSLMVTVTA